ncbi:MAG: Trk system potassium transporter TrkA [Hyphomonas sp.]|jgi:trk/ktr system potassium uptake protein|nr:Trk system potassium transporter TrkA [Henriciella sp.]MBO6696335.1 Trk system potassium transporter TrkA [Henriciella sp.]MCH9752134.1 Trk system potassium transporter TrkA [Alphaproteobacteria bacterium]MCR9223530.1 Trk system potassium transporter TrkA [Hyphomonas sp.]
MRVIICGAGRVGQGIARHLAQEHHDITMIDENDDLIEQVQIDFDVRGVVGHAAHPNVLRTAGADAADMLIAVTHFDEINMVICQVADTLFSVPTKIARVRAQAYLDDEYSELFSKSALPIDLIISPEIEVGEAILRRIRAPSAVSSISFESGELQVLGMKVQEDSPLLETALDQIAGLFPDLGARVIGIKRGSSVFAPRGNDQLQPADTAYVAVSRESTPRLNKLFNRDINEHKRVVIVGGGNVGLYVATQLEREGNVRVRIIEADSEKADIAVSALKQTIVIHGDGLARDVLEEAGADQADIVIAVTNDDKTNMLIGKLAKQIGARRTHALVNAYELVAISQDLDIDAVLDPRALSVSKILTKLRRGRILSVESLEDGTAEIAEGVTLDSSPLIGKPIDYAHLPDGVTSAAIIRDGKVIFPTSATTVQTDDRLLMFYEASATRKVEQFFRVSADFF